MTDDRATATATGEDRIATCWVCLATENEDRNAAWLTPCQCKGSSRWVHEECLQRWIDEKQRGNATAKVTCPKCNYEYIISYPNPGLFVYLIDYASRAIAKTSPFVAGGIFVGSVYWTAVTYGAVTVMQVLGHQEGLNMMERADPLFLLFGLPAIPMTLILGKMIRWEDYVLKIWRKYSSKLPLINSLFPDIQSRHRRPLNPPSMPDMFYPTRILCGAMILPTIATFVGKIIFGFVHSNFQRTLMGGIVFITIKGVLKIYCKQKLYLLQAHRIIKNYENS